MYDINNIPMEVIVDGMVIEDSTVAVGTNQEIPIFI